MYYKDDLDMFKRISTNDDYEIVIKDDIKFEEFIRIDYILDTIGLDDLKIYFFEKHYDKFKERMKQLDKIELEDDIIDDELYVDDLEFNWLESFVSKIQDKELRESMMDKLKITY